MHVCTETLDCTAEYAADAVLGLASMPPTGYEFANVTWSMHDPTSFPYKKKAKETKHESGCHLMQPVAWRCPDLGLSPKNDVCRIMLSLCAFLSCPATSRLQENLKRHIQSTLFGTRRSLCSGRGADTSKQLAACDGDTGSRPKVPIVIFIKKKSKEALHP